MATIPLVPEAEKEIETGDLITAETGVGIATGDLLGAESTASIVTGGLKPALPKVGLTPLGV